MKTFVHTDISRVTEDLISEINISQDISLLKFAGIVKAAEEMITVELRQLFPDTTHLDVKMFTYGPNNYEISIVGDEIGSYIYYGTAPHSFKSDSPMPIGEGIYARSVNHPGTQSRKEEIDAIVQRAAASITMERGLWG